MWYVKLLNRLETMDIQLTEKVCVPCKGGIPPLGSEEAAKFASQTPGWTLIDDGIKIVRDFKFGDFKASMAFVQQIGDLAEEEGHHPDIEFGWGYCRVTIFTHKIGGLHENDFIMAAKINLNLLPDSGPEPSSD